jgi:hypothetical protein
MQEESSAGSDRVGEFNSTDHVTDAALNHELRSIWELIQRDDNLRKATEEALGNKLVSLDLGTASTPFQASRPAAPFGIAEAIIVSVASQLLAYAGKKAVDALWERVFLPRLKARFGADLQAR